MKERNLQLDILKIMACFAVVVIHATGIITFNMRAKYSINHVLYYISGFAVPVFFMVNGYFLLNKEKISYKYVLKKIVNILLVVFSWSIILFLITYIATKKVTNPITIALNSLIQRDYFWQFWFFGALIIVFAVLPLLHKGFKNTKYAIFMTIFFILCCLAVDSLSIYRSINRKPIIQVQVIQTLRLWTWFAYYLLGGLLGKSEIMNYILGKVSKRLNVLIFTISSIIVSVYQFNMAHKYYKLASIEFFYDNILTFIWVTSLFILIYRCKIKAGPVASKCIGFMGDSIMGVYIIHVTVLNISTSMYKFNTISANILLIFIMGIISLVSAVIISKIPIVNRLIKL